MLNKHLYPLFEVTVQVFCQFFSQAFSIFLTNVQEFCFVFWIANQSMDVCILNNFSNSVSFFLLCWCLLINRSTYFHIALVIFFFFCSECILYLLSVSCVLLHKFSYSMEYILCFQNRIYFIFSIKIQFHLLQINLQFIWNSCLCMMYDRRLNWKKKKTLILSPCRDSVLSYCVFPVCLLYY